MVRSRAQRLLYRVADAGASLYGSYRSRRAEFLAHEPTPIADARMGDLVKVVGRLRGDGREYKAPLSAEACLWYRTVVRKVKGVVPFADGYFPFLHGVPLLARFVPGTTITEEESVDLFVDDESGSALVEARSARFSLVGMRSGWSVDSTPTFAHARDATTSPFGRGAAARRLLERYAVTAGFTVLHREVVLKEGDRVAVLGRPRMELDPSGRGSFRTPATRIVFDEPEQVLVSDEPGVF